VVDDAELPVAGVSLTFVGKGANVETLTDANGAFSVEVNTWVGGLSVKARKAAFEEAAYWLSSEGRATSRIHLHRLVQIAPGDAVHLTVGPGDASCGFDDEYLCRRVRIRPAASGTLDIRVAPDRSGVQMGVAASTDGFPRSMPRFSTRVAAGQEIAVDVLLWWQSAASEGVTVATELAPD
jgi:hypothetical protein